MNEIVMEITPEMEGERIDKCISNYLESLSRSYIQKIIKDGKAYVNDAVVKANYKVKVDDKVQFEIPDCEEPDIPPQDIPLDILYEDKDILIVNKPKDMVVHPAPGHYEGTLVNATMFHCKDELSGINGVLRPGIVHRIDKDTTGSIIICKNDEAHRKIAQQLKEHSITRKYRAIVYGNAKCPFKLEGQTLHAMTIGFIHPTTGEYVEYEAPLPEYFEHLLQILRTK